MRVNQSGNSPVQGSEVSSAKKSDRAGKAEGAKATPKSAAAIAAGDVAPSISTKAKDMAKAKAVASQAPDVREDKIADIKARIAAGTYKVNAEAIAEKMVDEHMSAKMSGMG